MLESVSKGASEGLEDIETTDANVKLAFLEKIQEGTTKALDDIVIPGFDPEEQRIRKKIKKELPQDSLRCLINLM